MSQPTIKNSQLTAPGLFDDGIYGWNDLLAPLSSGKAVAATDPAWSVFQNGIYAYSFPASSLTELWITFHIPHTYLLGSVVYPHVHWTTAGTNTGIVRWGFEYTVSKGYGQQSFPPSTTIYVEQAASGVAYRHMIGEVLLVDAIPATNVEPDSLVMMRVFRDANHASDTCTDAAFGLQVDLHHQVSVLSTHNRNYPFS